MFAAPRLASHETQLLHRLLGTLGGLGCLELSLANSCLSGFKLDVQTGRLCVVSGRGPVEEALDSGLEPRVLPPDPAARCSVALGKLLDFLGPSVIHLTKGVITPA